MKFRNIAKWSLIVSLIGMGVQAGTATFALVGSNNPEVASTSVPTAQQQAASPDINSVELSPEVSDAIRASDPSHYEKNIVNYKELLVRLDVHPKFRTEIERLLIGGRKVSDVLIAYEFLYQEFGTSTQLESLVVVKSSGKPWEAMLKEYRQNHPAFVPQAFDTNELEEIVQVSKLSSDDIMIADHFSFVTGKPFKEIITAKLEEKRSWKELAAQFDVLHTTSILPRVQITVQQINRWTETGKMTEEQVAEAFVLASETGETPETVIQKLLNGDTQESILAESFIRKYE